MFVRITHFTIKPEKFDDLVAWNDEVREKILNIPGMISGYMTRASETEMISVAIYEDKESVENAQDFAKEFMEQMSEFLDGSPDTTTAEVIRSFNK